MKLSHSRLALCALSDVVLHETVQIADVEVHGRSRLSPCATAADVTAANPDWRKASPALLRVHGPRDL